MDEGVEEDCPRFVPREPNERARFENGEDVEDARDWLAAAELDPAFPFPFVAALA